MEHLSFAGLPAAKIRWQGVTQGMIKNGVTYCVMVNGKILSLLIEDSTSEMTPNMREAMQAFEGMKIGG